VAAPEPILQDFTIDHNWVKNYFFNHSSSVSQPVFIFFVCFVYKKLLFSYQIIIYFISISTPILILLFTIFFFLSISLIF